MKTEYVTSALTPNQLPPPSLPEIAVVGRSNSGKSTLINSLVGQKNLVRSGKTPGQTQLINFFRVDDRWLMADLPGYGFSAAKQAVTRHWQDLTDAYLTRPTLNVVLFLSDARRDLDDDDLGLLAHLTRVTRVIMILTKTDKLNQKERAARQKALRARLDTPVFGDLPIMMISAQNGEGIVALRKAVFASKT